MQLFFHYCKTGFSNCYILGSDPLACGAIGRPEGEPAQRYAVIIDPGRMDAELIQFIEGNRYQLLAVLVTHSHISHVHGLGTLLKIYDIGVYGANADVSPGRTTPIHDGDVLRIGPFTIEVISVPGHSADSVVFKVDQMLFTGDSISAGLTGDTASVYGETMEISGLRSRILSLPGDCTLFPGHGPPSSLEAERRFNAGVNRYESGKKRHPRLLSPFQGQWQTSG